jgi:magnesium chelatase family protein
VLAILDTAVVHGLRGELVRVEVDIAQGLPSFHIVGLPDAALSEARERVRSAIRNAGFS